MPTITEPANLPSLTNCSGFSLFLLYDEDWRAPTPHLVMISGTTTSSFPAKMTLAHERILNLVLVVVLVSESKALYFQIVRRYSLVVYGRKIVGLVPQFCLWNVKGLTLGRTGRIPPTFDGLVWYRSWDTSSVHLLSFPWSTVVNFNFMINICILLSKPVTDPRVKAMNFLILLFAIFYKITKQSNQITFNFYARTAKSNKWVILLFVLCYLIYKISLFYDRQPDYRKIGKYCNLWRNYGDIQVRFSLGIFSVFKIIVKSKDRLISSFYLLGSI